MITSTVISITPPLPITLGAASKFRRENGNQSGATYFLKRMPQRSLTMSSMHCFCGFSAALLGSWLCIVPFSAAQADVLITIDKTTQQMTVAFDGATRWIWPISTGRRGYDTPAGSFQPFRMEQSHYSKEWDDAPMPYSIFFTGEGHAIHGSFETRRLGRPVSHGCVRLSPNNAAKLFAVVKREGLSNAKVVVIGDLNMPAIANRRTPPQEAQKVQQARKSAPIRAPAAIPAPPDAADTAPYAPVPEQAFGYAPAQPLAAPPAIQQPGIALPKPAAAGFARPPGLGWN
jgi:hypothetical protein